MVEHVALIVAVLAIVAACLGVCLRWDRPLFALEFQFSLRALLLLLAIGPPLLATVWTNRDYLFQLWDAPPLPRPSAPPRQPVFRPPPRPSRGPSVWTQPLTAQQRTPEAEALHFLAGVAAAVLYPLAVVLMAGVFWTASSWRRPPRKFPLLFAAMLASLLATATFLTFVITHPHQPTADERHLDDLRRRSSVLSAPY